MHHVRVQSVISKMVIVTVPGGISAAGRSSVREMMVPVEGKS